MTSTSTARVDMHCHSTASELGKLGIQRSVGLPECATPPEEVYELAKRRGMDFVTITDHDTIDGCLELADRHDVFVSEELTTWFKDEPQAVHVLCYGITPDDHEFLQGHARDLETCVGLPDTSARSPARSRIRSSSGGATGGPPPPAPDRAVRDLGGPERLAGTRTEPAGGPVHGHTRRHRDRWLRRPRRRRHRPHLDRDSSGVDAGRVSGTRSRGRGERPRRPGRARPSGRTPRWRWQRARSWRTPRLATPLLELTPAHIMNLAQRVVADGEERGGDETASSARTKAARSCAPGSSRSASTRSPAQGGSSR